MLDILQAASLNLDDEEEFDKHGLQPVDPFWKHLPYCDFFTTFTPDLLHQLHKGMFGDHISEWACKTINDEDEIDCCFKNMTGHPLMCHFRKGISLISQWMGEEYKEVKKVFLGVILVLQTKPLSLPCGLSSTSSTMHILNTTLISPSENSRPPGPTFTTRSQYS